jgi:hypothetical protein
VLLGSKKIDSSKLIISPIEISEVPVLIFTPDEERGE